MDEHIWNLVEKFISGIASEAEVNELQHLLALYPAIYITVKEFLFVYNDPDPQVSKTEIYSLLSRVEFLKEETATAAKGSRFSWAKRSRQPALNIQKNTQGKLTGVMSELTMAGYFFKITVRSLQRNLAISLVNITGLAVGIASAVLIMLWVQNQLSYDQFHQNKDRIFQVFNSARVNGEVQCWGSTPQVLAPVLKAEYPQVEEAVRATWVGAFVLKTDTKQLESQGLLADPGFLKVFSFPLLKGSVSSALSGQHSIVLTQKLAKKLFGNADPMGKIVKVDSNANFTVTAVMKDLPNNTMFTFEYLVPFSYRSEVGWASNKWDAYSGQTYLMLKPGIGAEKADVLFKNVYRQHNGDKRNDVIVQPLTQIWLYNNFENGGFKPGQLQTVQVFMIIAALIMLIACINYMNLGTARSTRRAKEVGIRKVAGAGKQWLVKQFLGESVFITFLAGAVGLFLVQVSLPAFNELIGKALFTPFGDIRFWLISVGFLLFTGIVSGSYPAFYLSAFKPINVLKGTFKAANALIAPRKVLVVLQFTFAIAFIICTTVIYRQIKYAQNRDTGYNLNHLVFVYMKGNMAKNYTAINDELMRSGAVNSITRTNSPMLDIWTNNDSYQWEGKDPGTRLTFAEFTTDKNFTKTIGLPILQGRDIDMGSYPSDTSSVLLNEDAVKTMGFKNPVGQTIKCAQGVMHVVGVVKNFVTGSPYISALPIVIRGDNKLFGSISIKLNDKSPVSDNIKTIGLIFKKYNPDYPFDFKFYDQSYSLKFEEDKNAGTLAAVFSGLTIFISCLGLFALAACMAEGRIKEIGIRKVLGASVARITALLTKDFLVLVCIAFVIASPIAWWLMSAWLQNFPYHVNLSGWIFVFTGMASVIIAFSTVVYQAVTAAIVNPVKSLRNE